jgi:putative hydrolase of the HAD superfamily
MSCTQRPYHDPMAATPGSPGDLEVWGPEPHAEPSRPPVRAVFFDFGGVLTVGPWGAFAAYERQQGLPEGFIRRLNATNPDTNAWACLERGQIDVDTFARRFEAEAAAAGGDVDAAQLFEALRVGGELRPAMVEAVRRCHDRLPTGLLTNNFSSGTWRAGHEDLLACFDVILESSAAGLRKPDPDFYRQGCASLGVEPGEAVFLDDLGVNLKPARQLGMQTIKVTDPDVALAELEAAVGFPVR